MYALKAHVMWLFCHHGMECPLVSDGRDGLQIWSVATNIVNTQSRTDDKGGFPVRGLDVALINLHHKK
jgi:hypothetical protein